MMVEFELIDAESSQTPAVRIYGRELVPLTLIGLVPHAVADAHAAVRLWKEETALSGAFRLVDGEGHVRGIRSRAGADRTGREREECCGDAP